MSSSTKRMLVMHVVYRFDVGGLENGMVNLINRMPSHLFRHVVVALTQCVPSFCDRIESRDVEFLSLDKSPGHGIGQYPSLYRLFRRYRPDVVHTRNLAALEAVVPAWAAGVPVRVHGEHGWDVTDPDGTSWRYCFVRRLYRPFVSHYVALSGHIAAYLSHSVGAPTDRIARICNGVDAHRFCPSSGERIVALADTPPLPTEAIVVGTVGRLQAVKNQISLVRAFARLVERGEPGVERVRLVIIGGGPLRDVLAAELERCGLADRGWLAGERADIPEVMRSMDIFVLPSLGEGISNTILEAMASGLPVVATNVGGNAELVEDGRTGALVPPDDDVALADAIAAYIADEPLRRQHGLAGRLRVESEFSLDCMVDRYATLYRDLLETSVPSRAFA